MEAEYLFKLNVQPHVLEKYSGEKINTLKNELIPKKIAYSFAKDLFSQTDSDFEFQSDKMSFQIVKNYQEVLESEEYKQLLELTHELTLEYVRISRDYVDKNGIHYSQDYLEKHQEAIELRKKLLATYEELKPSQLEFSGSIIDDILEKEYQFDITSKVGTGIDHIRKVKRISLFLEKLDEDTVETVPIEYVYDTERLGIRARNQQEAISLHRIIERNINQSGKDDVGKVTINPIYRKIVLDIDENSTRSIEIITTYPNNPDDELKAFQSDFNEYFGTKETRITSVLSDTKQNRKVWKKLHLFIDKYAKVGYLRGVNKNGTSVINEDESLIKTGGKKDEQ